MTSRIALSRVCLEAAIALLLPCILARAEELVNRQSQAAGSGVLGEQQIIAAMIDHNQARSDALFEYTAGRTYRVSQPNGKVHAQVDGVMEFHAPDRKRFVVTSEQGSGLVRRLALKPLIATEIKTAAGKDRHDSAITPANYRFELLGEETVRNYRCYVLRAFPRRVDKYLFEGKLWVDEGDFAVVRMEGRPAANLSFWIKRAEFVREYQRVDGFWLPMKDETEVEVRIYGKKILTIDHRDYTVRGG